jgi:hypothetical protein
MVGRFLERKGLRKRPSTRDPLTSQPKANGTLTSTDGGGIKAVRQLRIAGAGYP